MIVDRYHFSLSKMRPNMLLTVAYSNYGNRTKWACAKLNLVPRAHVSSGQCLGADQKTRGLWERDYAKVSMWTSMWVENPFVYVLHTTIKFEMEYFLRRANVGKKSWRSIYEKTAMERAGKTTIFPGVKSEFGECVYNSKFEHRRPCRILWLFMLVVLLETFYRTIQRNTGKLKSFT